MSSMVSLIRWLYFCISSDVILSKDFSEENLAHAGITERYENTDLEDILEKICKKILGQ